jgi:hypothetical protein
VHVLNHGSLVELSAYMHVGSDTRRKLLPSML